MGGSKKQTVGYWYHPTFVLGLHMGPCDAFLRFRAGDVDAWSGELTASGTISIDAPDLWGGTESEGGIQGDVDVMFGEATQMPSAYYDSVFGADPSAHRGTVRLTFKGNGGYVAGPFGTHRALGRFGAMNPYPKAVATLTRRVFKGWDADACWYPEKAAIAMADSSATTVGYFAILTPTNGTVGLYADEQTVAPMTGTVLAIAQAAVNARNAAYEANSNPQRVWLISAYYDAPSGNVIAMGNANNHDPGDFLGVAAVAVSMICPDGYVAASNDSATVTCTLPTDLIGMNAAHLIYDSLVAECMQGEPVGLINDASFRAAADKLFDEGFGLCTEWDPDTETCEAFRQRICNVIGAHCSRSTVDGQWYLDLARGDYDLEALPVLTDDDILEFRCDPSTLDDAVNQVAVRWFDPLTKQERTTAPVHALGAIHAMGGIVPETADYLELPIESLADRCAARDLLAKATPTKRFSLATNRVPYAWRRGSYFRLQAPKRGIADMVCLVGEIGRGTLRSGGITLVAIQDVYSMPATSYVVGQPPVTGGTTAPVSVAFQLAVEAPYAELAGVLSAADLAALDADAGFVLVAGVRPSSGANYQLRTRLAGGEFDSAGTFDWCPGATVNEASDDLQETEFTLSAATDLAAVQLGSAAMWGSEMVRVDALDIDTGAVSFGRGCGDTVPHLHDAAERVYFYDTWSGSDQVEYVTGETVEAKLLTRIGTALLLEALAPTASVTLDQRAARPYAPARIRINGEAQPIALSGELVAAWVWRDRLLQADQLVDNEAASIGPEAGTTATVRWYVDGVLVQTDTAVTTTSQTYTPTEGGVLRVEIEAVRDGLASWQAQAREFLYSPAPAGFLETESGDLITRESGTPISLE